MDFVKTFQVCFKICSSKHLQGLFRHWLTRVLSILPISDRQLSIKSTVTSQETKAKPTRSYLVPFTFEFHIVKHVSQSWEPSF